MALNALTRMTDEVGVLSIYANANPSDELTQPPAWHKRVNAELTQLKETLREGPRERWLAVGHRLAALTPELDWLFDPTRPGRGRALFATVDRDEVRHVSLQTSLLNGAFLRSRAYVRPLVNAWSAHGPVGALAVSADNVRVVDVRFGRSHEVASFPYAATVDSREPQGPAAASPMLAQHSVSPHDMYARRETDRLTRHLRSIGPDIAKIALDRGWEYVALTGEASLTQAVADGMPAGFWPDLVRVEHHASSLPTPKLAELVGPALSQARRHHDAVLVQRARDGALAGNAGACGLQQTLQALQEGRVAHLLLAADGEWHGRRAGDGSLIPDTDNPESATRERDPFLGERMIELAFHERADVTVLPPATATPLDDGVGAILRW
jgi:hypothetical protein